MVGFTFVIAFFMQLFDAGVVMPIMNRLTGTTTEAAAPVCGAAATRQRP
jgi:hypothetical protein